MREISHLGNFKRVKCTNSFFDHTVLFIIVDAFNEDFTTTQCYHIN